MNRRRWLSWAACAAVCLAWTTRVHGTCVRITACSSGLNRWACASSVSAAAKEGTNRVLESKFAHEGAILGLAWSGGGVRWAG